MSQKSVVNVEIKCCPLYYWLPACYKNENEIAYGRDNQRVTSKVFAFYYLCGINI